MESRIDTALGNGVGATTLQNQYGIIITRDAQGRLVAVDATALNVATSTVSGVDVGLSHEGNVNLFEKEWLSAALWSTLNS